MPESPEVPPPAAGTAHEWLAVRPEGLLCLPGGFYIDPLRAVSSAVITHGHADHARPGNGDIYATAQTLAIMRCRYGDSCAARQLPLAYGERHRFGDVELWLAPAGHILGSAQVVLEYRGERVVISGDYKRQADPTCQPFQPVPCDVFVTEATFGLPVFHHPPIAAEVEKLLQSLQLFPQRCHLVGVYALGKCQRLILALRALGYSKAVYLHGALVKLCELYEREGIALGKWVKVSEVGDIDSLAGEIVLAPPSALADRWSRKLPDMLPCMASGWMQIRARARQRRVELPLVISDHCDWPALLQTLEEVNPAQLWVTHGREEALVHRAQQLGYRAQALSLLGYEEEESG